MTPAERIRVFIAGDIYPKRGLVRRFLEDDGYDVVGTAASQKAMVARIRAGEPDAVVVDGDLLVAGAAGGTLARIREAVPDAKVIVFTGGPAANGPRAPSGADGYLEKGVGLSALTALLGNMFVAEPPRIVQPAASGIAAAATGVAATASASDGPPKGVAAASNGNGAGGMARLVAIASGATLVVWGLIAMLATGGPTPRPVDRTEGGTGGDVIDLVDPMDHARATLRELVGALESGDYVLASLVAEELVDVRERAMEQGFSINGLDADITARLSAFVDLVPSRVNTALSSILGSLYPDLSDEGAQGGGGPVEGPNLSGGNGGGGDDNQNGDGDGDNAGHVHDNGKGKGHEMCRGKGHHECDEVAVGDHGQGNDGSRAGHANGLPR